VRKRAGKTRGDWGRGRGERLCSFFKESGSSIPASGIPYEWSILTLSVNTQADKKCDMAEVSYTSSSHTHEFDNKAKR